ncbi:hypothetical protein BDR03DRAFT_979696 [Suillus americanus]|nr:hypothetical protein BDR03DRAFT_979696 [Suillus americanus]
MVSTIHTDNKDESRVVVHPVRKTKPTAALLQHSEKAALPSQTKAINNFHAAEAAKLATERQLVSAETKISPAPENNKRVRSEGIFDTDIENSDDEHENAQKQVRRATVTEDSDDEHDDKRENAHINPKPKRVHQAAVMDQEDVDEDGILADINVQPITDPGPSREDKTRDLDRFSVLME